MTKDKLYKEILTKLRVYDMGIPPKITKRVKKVNRLNVSDIFPYDIAKFLKANKVPKNCDWGYIDIGDGAGYGTYVEWVTYEQVVEDKTSDYEYKNHINTYGKITKVIKDVVKGSGYTFNDDDDDYHELDASLLYSYIKKDEFVSYIDQFIS